MPSIGDTLYGLREFRQPLSRIDTVFRTGPAIGETYGSQQLAGFGKNA